MMTSRELHFICCLVFATIRQVHANPPIFNSEYDKAVLFLPRDIKNGTAIYRFAASDNENQTPLKFTVESPGAHEIVAMVNVSYTEADLVLRRSLLQSGVIYEIFIVVTDTAGELTRRRFRINVTDARGTPDHVFIDYENTYTVSEKEDLEAVIGRVTARSDEQMHQHVNLTIKGTNMFTINTVLRDGKRIVSGEIILHGRLDYEKKSFYYIQIEALNGYIEKPVDTRNIIYLPVLILVKDEQDTPPIFSSDFPSVVTVPSDMESGGKVAKVSAEDGDTDNKRAIRYSLMPGVDWQYFQVDSETGEIMLTASVAEVTHTNQGAPIILSIKAEEVLASPTDESASTTKDMVILLEKSPSVAPVFAQDNYEGDIEEHAPPASLVNIQGVTRITDSDVGMDGVFTLILQDLTPGQNIDHILEVTPNVMVNEGNFQIRVKNPALLDYEKFKELKFLIVAKELPESGPSSSATMTVHIQDINDNYPVFTQDEYVVTIPEDAKEGTFIAQVTAKDADSDQFGTVAYTKITGDIADKLHLDQMTGRVTVSKDAEHVFDRETQAEHVLTIEASDMGNPPKTNVTTLRIIVSDVNDNAPQFKRGVYEVVVDPNTPQTEPFLQVEAVDADEPGNSNSVVRYEILRGNRGDMFRINPQTGELSLSKTPSAAEFRPSETNELSDAGDDAVDEPSTYTLTVRAYDMGIPHRNSTVVVYVHFKTDSRSSMNVTIQYIFPTSVGEINKDKERVERFLSKLNGASTTIERVAPYGLDDTYEDIRPRSTLNEKSLVTTNVRYHKKSLVDLSIIARNGTSVISSGDESNTNQEQHELVEAGVSSGWKVALITLLIILAIILLLLICFCIWRLIRKADDRKVHPADEKMVDKSHSQVIEVVTSDQMALANGRQYREQERILANANTSNAVSEVDNDQTKRNFPPDGGGLARIGSAGPSTIRGGGPNRRTHVNYSRHLHGGTTADGGPATAGNSVRVELYDQGNRQVTALDDDFLLEDADHNLRLGHQQQQQQQQGRYRLGTQYEDDVEEQLEEIIVIDGDDAMTQNGVGPASQQQQPPRIPLRRIRRIIKRSPSRAGVGQKPTAAEEYEEWEPSSLPEWIGRIPYSDNDDQVLRRNVINRGGGGSVAYDQSGRRVIVRKYAGSLPGDRPEGQWFNSHGGHRNTKRPRNNEVAFRASQRSRARPRHRYFRDRSLTRASLQLEQHQQHQQQQQPDDSEPEVDEEEDDDEDDLIDFEESSVGRPMHRNHVAFERHPLGARRDHSKAASRAAPQRRRSDRDDWTEDGADDRHRPPEVKRDDDFIAATMQSRAVSARPLSAADHTEPADPQVVQDAAITPETKDSSTSPKLPETEGDRTRQDSVGQSADSPRNNATSPIRDNVAQTQRRKGGKRESRYMDWYKNLGGGGGGGGERGVTHSDADKRRDRKLMTTPNDRAADDGGKTFDDDETENVADEASTTVAAARRMRRGSDDLDDRRRRRRSTDQTTDRNKRSDTALDVIEAQMRLGGNGFTMIGGDQDDEDSGIGHAANDTFRSSRKQFLEKKSLFTIAYNQNKQDPLKDRDSSANNTSENRIT